MRYLRSRVNWRWSSGARVAPAKGECPFVKAVLRGQNDNVSSARVGPIDRMAQFNLCNLLRSDTPPSAVGTPKRLSCSARERARDNEKGRVWPPCPNRF